MPFWFTICHCGLIVQPCLKLKNTKINIVGKWRTLTSDKAETSLTSNYNFFPRFDIQNVLYLKLLQSFTYLILYSLINVIILLFPRFRLPIHLFLIASPNGQDSIAFV